MLSDYTTEELIFEVIKRSGIIPGPTHSRYADENLNSVVGIGNDNFADIFFSVDDYEALVSLVNK